MSKVKTKIGPLIDKNKQLTHDSREMANLLSEQYTKVFSNPIQATSGSSPQKTFTKPFERLMFTPDDLIKAIDELSSTAAAGPDSFPAILLKCCKSELVKPLHKLWNLSLHEGYVPLQLKKSIITPIHKGGSKANPANYRPISLTSHLIKIFEKVMRNHLASHITENNLFNPNQHGFRSGHSCLSELLDHYDFILNLLNENKNVDVVYLDFAKVFDKVDFGI